MSKTTKKPWPTKDVMTQIYDKHLWGGDAHDYYSGFGSHDNTIVKPYLEAVINFLKSFTEPLTVCDLGCGDFNIGKHLVEFTEKYIAVDIVEPLIERNKTLFKYDNLEFQCLDISKDELPSGDCAILRNVLQHLSNSEIQDIVNKLESFKYLILTEHIPKGNFIPNKDIIAGQGIRLKQNSGVNLTKVPFNLRTKKEQHLVNYFLDKPNSNIITYLYQLS
ncbi:class I SAM-dependent methyltransferase [Hyunsoonleella ulvae]|uniref:class I SAM-dependent methyltransferase n=1 Tax=Hyunsoonleella ulvae TaxID=2799948 RepID=UPI00293D7BB1|nr:class I SAM-dependent methyltransferase [Hyunsoonleella ulvae]